MEKPAPTAHPIHELLRRRWSPYTFAARPVEPATLCQLLEAARWAPSSYNEQPWTFFVATRAEPAAHARLVECLLPANQDWARHAPVLLLTVAKLHFSRNHKPNRVAIHDVGLAVANLVVQATALDLFTHQMAGIDQAKARQLLQIPEGYEPLTAIAIGYAGDTEQLPAELREAEHAPRERRPLGQFVFAGRWASPVTWLKP